MEDTQKIKDEVLEEQILALHGRGLTGGEISRLLNITAALASGIIKFGTKREFMDHLNNLKRIRKGTHKSSRPRKARAVVGDKQLTLVKTLVEAGLSFVKISKIADLSYSTVSVLARAKSIEDYREMQKKRLYKPKGKKTETDIEVKVGKGKEIKKEGVTITLSADQWNTLLVKLNAIHYDIVAIKNKKGLMF